jgi:copper(I)-binding protein
MSFRYPIAIILAALLFQAGIANLQAAESANPPDDQAMPGKLAVGNPWIQLGADDDLMQPAYARLINHTAKPIRITGVSARGYRLGMIHRVVLQDGIPRMSMVSTLTIPVGQTIQLDQKNYRFMFLGPRKTFKEGDKIKVKLQFKDREPESVMFVVSAKAPKGRGLVPTVRN